MNCIKNKIKLISSNQQITLLDCLDYAMDEGRMPLHTQISTKDFISILIGLIKSKDSSEVP